MTKKKNAHLLITLDPLTLRDMRTSAKQIGISVSDLAGILFRTHIINENETPAYTAISNLKKSMKKVLS